MADRACLICGVLFAPTNAVQKYCSEPCRKAAPKRRPGDSRPCAVCGVEFVPDKFQHRYHSRECFRIQRRAWSLGYSPRELFDLMARNDGSCDACGGELDEQRSPHVDHCHESGVLRGILHSRCNAGIGMALEDQERLFRWSTYLARHQLDLRGLCVGR